MRCIFGRLRLFPFDVTALALLISCPHAVWGAPPETAIIESDALLDLQTLPGDFDANGWVDWSDYFEFFLRHDGPGFVPGESGWEALDADADDDLDLRDFSALQNGFTSPFARFTNSANPAFSTFDVYDVDHEVVRFHGADRSIVWAATGTAYHHGSWTVNGTLLAGGGFQVRFGTSSGQPGAYFTETVPATVCNMVISGGNLLIFATSVPVPQD